jgi:metal-responsive CopG/Arc/MetJ family transcriptional regulator
MEQITIRIPGDTLEVVDERASESDESRSEVVRDLIQLGMNHDELQSELEQKEARITELRNQLQARGEVEESISELVERTETQSEALRELLEERQAEQEARHLGVVGRARRWLFGTSDSQQEEA